MNRGRFVNVTVLSVPASVASMRPRFMNRGRRKRIVLAQPTGAGLQ